jgi:hypothetical protein
MQIATAFGFRHFIASESPLFTGTPAGVGPVQPGDHLEGYLEGRKLLDFYIR